MRVIIQRVTNASVQVEGKIAGSIGTGLLVLACWEDDDTLEDIEWMSGKICRLRIFHDEEDVMNRSITDVNGDILLVSQFTLYASTKKGNRPSYIKAAKPEIAIPLYEKFKEKLQVDNYNKTVETGVFGADMKVELVNDGPVTIFIDSKRRE